jgi:ADP-heptose:LPS heptosyltransferase
MKVDTMRTIDYWAGVPLCFLSSIVLWLFTRKRKQVEPSNVLFIELSEMGSAILADPAMRKIKRESGCQLFFAIFQKNKPSLGLLNTVPDEHIFTIRENNLLRLLTDTVRFLFWSRRHNIDTVFDLELFSRFTAILTGFSGATNRVGYYSFHNEGLYRGEMLTHRVMYNPHLHIAKNFIALVNAVLSNEPQRPYSKTVIPDSDIVLQRYHPDEEALDQFASILTDIIGKPFEAEKHKIVLINANASELLIQRRWMPEYYVELVQRIVSDHPDVEVFLTGSPSEIAEMEQLHRQIDHPRCHNTAGEFTFEQLPLLYSSAHLMVTNDSGPGHFSAVSDLKVFVFYGPETPALYGSLGNSVPIYRGLACSPCVNAANHRKTDCQDNVCLKLIKPAEVYGMIESSLKASPATALVRRR